MAWTHISFVGFAAVSFAGVLVIPACGGSSQSAQQTEAGTDSGGGTDAPVVVADASDAAEASDDKSDGGHYPMPQVVNAANGPVLKAPKVYLVFYPGYTYETQLKAMAQALTSSSYWAALGKDYGVGALQVAGSIELTGETAPGSMQDSDIQAYLGAKLTSGAFGTPDPSAIYTIFYPTTTTISIPQGGLGGGNATSCSTFGGYHGDFPLILTDGGATQDFAYAVIPTCPNAAQGEQGGVTSAVSHEWIEAATDPFPSTSNGAHSAYAQVDDAHFIWIALGGGGEVGDMCVREQDAFYTPADVGFLVQRTWSNSFAKAGHDPCVPNLPGVPYFQSAPQLTDKVTFTPVILPGSYPTQGVTIASGKSKTIAVDLYSDMPTNGPWTVGTVDSVAQYLKQPPTLSFAWDKTQGQNGDRLHLTITVTTPQPAFGGGHPFIITSTLGTKVNEWAGLVMEN